MGVALEAAERFEHDMKHPGDRNGPLGQTGILVYRALWRRANRGTGRCDPSIKKLMYDANLSRRAVVEALKRLWDWGFVRWIRRLSHTGSMTIRGPQVAQATNAYELRVLPEHIVCRVPRWRERYRPKLRPRPPSDPAPRQRRSKSPELRVWAAWGRMGERIHAHLRAVWDRRQVARDQRESTQGVHTQQAVLDST